MYLVITQDDLIKLSPKVRAELMAALIPEPDTIGRFPPETEEYDWSNRVDLDDEQVTQFMEGCAPETIRGLRVIAKQGPVITGDTLEEAGIENYGHFQGRTTKRARTVTGDKSAYLLAWDDWASEDNQQFGCGHYAVTMPTYAALVRYFDL
jgi:hypothetical protein